MSNVIEFAKGERKVLVSNDKLALTGAVLGSLAGKSSGVTRFGVLKNKRVFEVLAAAGCRDEVKQVQEITNTFTTLQSKGIIALSGDKVQTAMIASEFAELASEVTQAAEKVELSPVTTGKRGRPAGSGANSQGSVKRNPAPAKGKRFSLVNGKVVAWTIGKPSKDQRLTECDEKGNIIADIAAINALYSAQEAKSMSVKRNPKVSAKLRYYWHNGVVTPFGRGKPSFDKLNNECTGAGEKIDNSAIVAAMRQPGKSGGGNASKVNQLEAQLSEMRDMMAKMMLAMGAGAAVAVAPAVAAAQVAAPTQETKVEPAKPAKAKAEKPKAEKPAKSKPSKPSKPKVEKVSKVAKLETEDDAYEAYASVSSDLGDHDPIAFDTDGFVVSEID